MNELKNQIDYIEIFGLNYLWTRIDPKDIIIDGKNITITYRDDYRMEDYHVEIHGENQLISDLTASIIAKIQLYGSQINDKGIFKFHITDVEFIDVTIKGCSNEQLLELYRNELEQELEYDLMDEFNENTISVTVHLKED